MSNGLQYLLDGVDLESAGVVTLLAADATLPIVGDDLDISGRPGQLFRRRRPGAADLQIGLLIEGTPGGGGTQTVAAWQANWQAFLARAWQPRKTRTLTRRLTTPGGVIEATAQTTLNAYPSRDMQGDRACTTVLDLKLLDGYLYDTTQQTVNAPGAVTIAGDADTSAMTISMAAGTLTNTTTGAVLTYTGTGTASIDVATWTATAGGGDVTADVSWPAVGHDLWFDLDAGANTLTGTATIVYSPAYLP